jgi:hypothetical protein
VRPWIPQHGEAATAKAREMVEKMSRTGKGCRHIAADYRRHRHAGYAVDRRTALKDSLLHHVFQQRQLRQQLDRHAEDLIRLRQPMSAPIGLFLGVVLFMFLVFHVPVSMRNPWVPRFSWALLSALLPAASSPTLSRAKFFRALGWNWAANSRRRSDAASVSTRTYRLSAGFLHVLQKLRAVLRPLGPLAKLGWREMPLEIEFDSALQALALDATQV